MGTPASAPARADNRNVRGDLRISPWELSERDMDNLKWIARDTELGRFPDIQDNRFLPRVDQFLELLNRHVVSLRSAFRIPDRSGLSQTRC